MHRDKTLSKTRGSVVSLSSYRLRFLPIHIRLRRKNLTECQNTTRAFSPNQFFDLDSNEMSSSSSTRTTHKRGIVIGHVQWCLIIRLLLLVDLDTRENIPCRSQRDRSQNGWARNCFSFILCIAPFTLAYALKLEDQVKICGHTIFFQHQMA